MIVYRPFGRVLRVRIGPPGVPDAARSFGSPDDNGPGHHVAVSISASDEGKPSECTIRAYNLSEGSLRLFEDPANVAIIQAGYRSVSGYDSGEFVRTLYQGNPVVSEIRYSRSGGDRELSVVVRDGGRALDYGRMDVSWASETTADQIVDEILRQTGLSRGVIDLGDYITPRRYVYSGPARRALDRIVASVGGSRRWYVKDGALYIAPVGTDTGGDALVISDTSNLLQAPTRDKKGLLRVQAMLDPGMRVGRKIKLESRRDTGFYTVRAMSVDAASDGGPFDMNLSVVPYV